VIALSLSLAVHSFLSYCESCSLQSLLLLFTCAKVQLGAQDSQLHLLISMWLVFLLLIHSFHLFLMEGFSYTNFSTRVCSNQLAYAFSFTGYVFVYVFCKLVCRLIRLPLKAAEVKKFVCSWQWYVTPQNVQKSSQNKKLVGYTTKPGTKKKQAGSFHI
jgi:hypothetical protein